MDVGSSVSFQATTSGYTDYYLAHDGDTVNIQVVDSSSSTTLQEQASWNVVTGLGNSACVSFESVDTPGSYIVHIDFVLQVAAGDGTKQFNEDATFCPQDGLSGEGNSIRAWGYPTRYFRHYAELAYIASNSGPHAFDAPTSFNDDATWIIGDSFA